VLIKPDCIPCLLKASLAALRQVSNDTQFVTTVFTEILTLPMVQNAQWDITGPEMYEQAIKLINKNSGCLDPFSELKQKQNQRALELYPMFKAKVAESEDPLVAAVKLSIMGNSSDLLMFENTKDLESLANGALGAELPEGVLRAFQTRVAQSGFILFFGDNSGEIILDRILIKVIREHTKADIVYVVRHEPALNDVTMKEACKVGMNHTAELIDNGIEGPLPGTIIPRCSGQVRTLFKEADMVISKGGGNYDTLEETRSYRPDIFFLLLAKCYPYCQAFKTKLFDLVLAM